VIARAANETRGPVTRRGLQARLNDCGPVIACLGCGTETRVRFHGDPAISYPGDAFAILIHEVGCDVRPRGLFYGRVAGKTVIVLCVVHDVVGRPFDS
jgi:hypothetical protein